MPDAAPSTVASLLAAERACCRRLAPLLDAERTAAAAYDHAALLACLREREILQADWERAAAQRRRHLEAAGRTLAELAAADPALAREIDATARDAEAVRRAQGINEGIVRAALAQVTDLLAVMRRERSDSRYDGRAALTGQALSSAGARWSA
ncbi:MAG: flagellar export chaperone FlgN [Deltaproteobacteria bacterium]|nr:flagellar export chaperone FlgN [Deltaproteobacteria bacterium]